MYEVLTWCKFCLACVREPRLPSTHDIRGLAGGAPFSFMPPVPRQLRRCEMRKHNVNGRMGSRRVNKEKGLEEERA
jgi:hypothetical protein